MLDICLGFFLLSLFISHFVADTCIFSFNPFSASPIFGQVQKFFFFLDNLLLARFLCWRDISRDLVFREGFEVFFFFFAYKHEKNEKSSQK